MNLPQPYTPTSSLGYASQPAHGHRPPPNPLLFAIGLLRGRFAIAAALAVLLAIPAGIAGFMATKPKYEALGVVHIAPTKTVILNVNEVNQTIPHFDLFVASEAARIGSQRVISMASQDPKLAQAGWPTGIAGEQLLVKSLKVIPPRRGTDIEVVVEHEDGQMAAAAVNAVLDAYDKVQSDEVLWEATEQEQKIENRIKTLDSEILAGQRRMSEIGAGHPLSGLRTLYDSKVRDLAVLDGRYNEMKAREASLAAFIGDPAAAPATNPSEDATPLVEDPSTLLARRDPAFARLLEREREAELALHLLRERFTPEHPSYRRAESDLALIRSEIAWRLENADPSRDPMVASSGVETSADPRVRLTSLKAEMRATEAHREELNREARQLGEMVNQVEKIQKEVSQKEEQRRETSNRLTELRIERQDQRRDHEAESLGRVSIRQRGTAPFAPTKDRRPQLAAAGAMAGAGLGVGLVGLYGFFRGSVRYIQEIDASDRLPQLLGTLPEIDPSDELTKESAAASVHQIRNILDASTPRREGEAAVYTITSPTAGDGKTSISQALGMSFALSGQRTLLIDADFIGRGLTCEVGLDRAPGLMEAVGAERLNGELHRVQTVNLSIMPTGAKEGFLPEQLSARRFASVLNKLRGQFDTIIIDTGPILGGLEAHAACINSDEVLIVVGRGQGVRLVQAAVKAVTNTGARNMRMIFNRAQQADYYRSSQSRSASVRSQGGVDGQRTPRPGKHMRPPLVLAEPEHLPRES